MCPITILTATVVAATAVSAVSALSAGAASSRANQYNAAMATQNAAAAKDQATAAAMIQQEQARKTMGATEAAYGASGITMDGTPMDVLSNSASSAERDRQNILYKGQLQAAGYNDQASLDEAAASNDTSQSYLNASGILLSGGAKAYGMSGNFAGPETVTVTPRRY